MPKIHEGLAEIDGIIQQKTQHQDAEEEEEEEEEEHETEERASDCDDVDDRACPFYDEETGSENSRFVMTFTEVIDFSCHEVQ